MFQRFQDAMAIVQHFGRPDLFITMTCNPKWNEIISELLPGQEPPDRPDLLTRVFKSKFEALKADIVEKGVFGKVIAYVYVIEFQKRGLPHVHMLIILDEHDKVRSPMDYDQIVRAEIPNRNEEPELHKAVLKHMIHGPCGIQNRQSPCMKNGKCKRGYPKKNSSETYQGTDSYPVYRRRVENEPVRLNDHSNVIVDSRWVVPYNPWVLLKYDCHINVEICSSIQSVKYLYKYVYKGPDRVCLQVQPEGGNDEIQHFVDARWVCAPEALWKIFKFNLYRMYPSVERLQIHLPNRQQVRFHRHDSMSSILTDERHQKTMLTEFFEKNREEPTGRHLLYKEFPQHFCWDSKFKKWNQRRATRKVIGRIYTISPAEGEKFYLRVLLNHVRGPTSFEDLLTFNCIRFNSFREAAERRGLLEHDNSIRQCLHEASIIRMPSALRRLFATILIFCAPTGIRDLWNEFHPFMIEDYPSFGSQNTLRHTNMLLRDLNLLLAVHGTTVANFDLPSLSETHEEAIPRIIQDEYSISICEEDLHGVDKLNTEQKNAFDAIIGVVHRKESGIFFIDGPGGTGKTFLYRTIIASLRKEGHIVLATATSGIAATLLPGGRTAHSKLRLPITPNASSVCSISKQSAIALLIKRATAIVWDEAPMAHRHLFEALDRTLRDIMEVDQTFGGKVLILGGDFRQILPVVPKGTRAEMIDACIVKSTLWRSIKVMHLTQNMRTIEDPRFAEFLMRIGSGDEPTIKEDMIRVPDEIAIRWEGFHSVDALIDNVFPGLQNHLNDRRYMVERGILTPLNEDVDYINDYVLNRLPGNETTLYSYDEVEGDTCHLYQQEFLNSISPGGLPPHILRLKAGVPIMLLRNLDPKAGLCNGTRLLCRACTNNVIDAEILTGELVGNRVFIPRIPLKSTENVHLPFVMIRKQFPVRLSFALTINKAQGQTLPNVGIYLPSHVFSHGQLYVALSRGISMSTTHMLIKNDRISGEDEAFTRNVVYKEVLLN